MTRTEPKTTIGATVTLAMKERIKYLAKKREWTVGNTLRLFIDRYWEDWEKELGIEFEANSSNSSDIKE